MPAPRRRTISLLSAAATQPPEQKPAADIYQLRVTLRYSEPAIWRRVQAPSDINLFRLHRIIQVVMGWTDSHLHQFIVGNRTYGTPDPEFDSGTISERRVKLYAVAPQPRSTLTYEYDFGDSWEHEIVVEAMLPADPAVQYPVCLAGARACPPEDCGGIPGYENLLGVVQDPTHEEYEETIQWLGGPFDPDAFDLDAVNRKLRRMR